MENMAEVEIFRNGGIYKEQIEFKKSNEILLLNLCNKIRTDQTAENKSVLEFLLSEMCAVLSANTGSVWKLQGDEKKVISIFGSHISGTKSLIKRFNPKDKKKILISDDPLSDVRLRKRKAKRPSKTISLPVATLPKGKTIRRVPSITYSLIVIPMGENVQLVLESSRKNFISSDIENISILISLVERALQIDSPGEDGIVSTLYSVKKEKEINGIKDIFLATVSHELRTPLNGIVGMITMLKDAGPLNQKQHEYLTILMECSHQLMNMMNNLLDFSKMVSNRLVLLKTPININKSVNDAVLMVEGKARSKGLKFSVNVQNNIPTLIGDGQRLTQILSNLLSNAVKFTENGYVKLKVRAERNPVDEEESLPYVKRWRVDFSIEDSGIGIPIQEQTKIFEVFHQSYNIDSLSATNGTGLGLSISKELVKMMGGKIDVSSEGIQGKGSIFSFYIITEEEIKMNELETDHKNVILGSKVMVVDDRPEYRLQLADMLFKWGCSSTIVSSGEEALQQISHGIEFDTIIVDICMKYMSGTELAQELRNNPKTATTPLIALSSIDLQNGTELFDIYMNKPIDQNYLFPALLECLIKKKAEKAPLSRMPFIKRGKAIVKKIKRSDLKILIAEDDHNNAFTIKEMLCYLGFNLENIKTVENGEKCVVEAKKNKYNVVLMDILMPKMNGLEATKHIRQLNPRPYIVAVSAAVQNSDKERCQQVGVDSYLTKPVLKDKLNSVLSVLVSD